MAVLGRSYQPAILSSKEPFRPSASGGGACPCGSTEGHSTSAGAQHVAAAYVAVCAGRSACCRAGAGEQPALGCAGGALHALTHVSMAVHAYLLGCTWNPPPHACTAPTHVNSHPCLRYIHPSWHPPPHPPPHPHPRRVCRPSRR